MDGFLQVTTSIGLITLELNYVEESEWVETAEIRVLAVCDVLMCPKPGCVSQLELFWHSRIAL